MRKFGFVSLAVLALGSAGAMAQSASAPSGTSATAAAANTVTAPRFGAWGFDLAAMDTSVRPGDDFDRYANGKWQDATTIPADRPMVGTFANLSDLSQDQTNALLTSAAPDSGYGAFFSTYIDESAAEKAGLKPLQADLVRVRTIASKSAFAREMGASGGRFGGSLVSFGVNADTANPTMNILYLGQSGLGLPNRDYYLDPQFAKQREAYVAFLTRLFTATGQKAPAAAAQTVMAFETDVARLHWTPAQRRDIEKNNTAYSSAELAKFAPGIDWAAFFAGMKVPPQARMVVGTNTAVQGIAALFAKTPLATLKLWQEAKVAGQASPYLTKAMVNSQFEFTKSLSGVSSLRPRWRRGVAQVDGSIGEMVGRDYVARYFPATSKAKMEQLVANLKLAMADRIRANSWMGDSTKAAALDKLNRMSLMVGYPDNWRDYSGLKIVPGDLYGNVQRASAFNHAYRMGFLGQPVNRKLWAMNPQTVNAYNGGLENKIVFPAAILQPPFFDPQADDAANYGAIGVVIGHEISHGFDDQGRKIDATGRVRDWWTAEDAKRFEAEAKIFGEQYARFEAAPGAFVNPKLTMGENIADFAGLQVALDAYHRSLGGKPAPVIDGLTGDQRFFLAYAQVWRAKSREDALRNQVATDPHSPPRYRVLGPLPMVQGWYDAFDVKPGDKMFIAPEKRAKIW